MRIGLHAGSAHLAGDDYGGFEVNRAARIAAADRAGRSCSRIRSVRSRRPACRPAGVRDLGRHRLKAFAEPERLFQLDVEGLPAVFPPSCPRPAAGNLAPRLTSFVGRQDELQP